MTSGLEDCLDVGQDYFLGFSGSSCAESRIG